MDNINIKVTAVAVVFGKRWRLLKQVIDAVFTDSKVARFIVVDNGCEDQDLISQEIAERGGDRLIVLKQEKNIGYSPAIAKGLEYARSTDCDYVFVLDDDCVPEAGAIDMFLSNLKLFPDNKIILAANRINVPGYKDIFYKPTPKSVNPKGTIFEVFSLKKIVNLFYLIFNKTKKAKGPFVPIIPIEAFVTGGSFIPIDAVREAPLPDSSLLMYGEDLQYAWGIRKLGYNSYLCARPVVLDIDMTFPGSHIYGLFDSQTPLYKVYLRIRNSVIISRKNTYQSKSVLLLNIIIWIMGLLLLGLFRKGFTKNFRERTVVILKAVRDGYNPKHPLPKNVKLPG